MSFTLTTCRLTRADFRRRDVPQHDSGATWRWRRWRWRRRRRAAGDDDGVAEHRLQDVGPGVDAPRGPHQVVAESRHRAVPSHAAADPRHQVVPVSYGRGEAGVMFLGDRAFKVAAPKLWNFHLSCRLSLPQTRPFADALPLPFSPSSLHPPSLHSFPCT